MLFLYKCYERPWLAGKHLDGRNSLTPKAANIGMHSCILQAPNAALQTYVWKESRVQIWHCLHLRGSANRFLGVFLGLASPFQALRDSSCAVSISLGARCAYRLCCLCQDLLAPTVQSTRHRMNVCMCTQQRNAQRSDDITVGHLSPLRPKSNNHITTTIHSSHILHSYKSPLIAEFLNRPHGLPSSFSL